jgi:hypothetical protein
MGEGTQALREALGRAHGDPSPRTFRPLLAWSMGGPDPLDGVDCFAEPDGHAWHYVGVGLDRALPTSPHRVALGVRIVRRAGETQPPAWPADLLQLVARLAVTEGEPPVAGDAFDLSLERGDSMPAALVFADDPEVHAVESADGPVVLVHAYGITRDELDAVRAWQCERFVELVRTRDPALVTDPHRASHRQDPAFERAVQLGIDRDGSSFGEARADKLAWERRGRDGLRLVVGAAAVPDLLRMLRGRIPFGRPFRLEGPNGTVVFWPEDLPGTQKPEDDAALTVDLSVEMADRMRERLRASRGTYAWPEVPGLELVVEASEIRGPDGEIVEVLG